MKTARRLTVVLSLFVAVGSILIGVSQTVLNIPVGVLALVTVTAIGVTVLAGTTEVRSWRTPTPEDPPLPSRPVMPKSPAEKAVEAMENAHDVSSRTERKVRIRIDTEDASSD